MSNVMQSSLDDITSDVVARPRESVWPTLSMDKALSIIEQCTVDTFAKYVPITAVRVGHVLAECVVALSDVPEMRTSMKDGYAVIASEGPGNREVVGSSSAGTPFLGHLERGQCVRISTGGTVPPGSDAVVMVERTRLVTHDNVEELIINIEGEIQPGQDIRMPGSDIRAGDIMLDKGHVLGSAEIGILAGSGRKSVLIYRKPKVCVMSTGNELVECNADVVPLGHIRDTNRPQLLSLFNSSGFKAIDAGIAADSRVCLVDAMRVAFRFANVLITSGGVSMGEKDLVKDVLQKEFGFQIHFGRVWMKPGLPSMFASGEVDGVKKLVVGLPGNPVSSWVSAQLFAVPLLRKMAGHIRFRQNEIKVKITEMINLDVRPEYRRAWLQYGEMQPLAITTGNQISSRLMSLSGANLLLKIPARTPTCTVLEPGTIIDAIIMTEALTKDIERVQEKLREIDGSISNLRTPRGEGLGINRRISNEFHSGDRSFSNGSGRRLTIVSDISPLGHNRRRIEMNREDARTFPTKRQRIDDCEDDADYDSRPKKTLQSTVVMPSIETKSREEKIEELNKTEKKEIVTRNRRMFSNLLMGTLSRFQKDEKKVHSVEKIQADKQLEVEKRLEEKKREEREKMASERHNLIEQRREQERELRALQRKKALMQYAEAKQEHYKLLMNFIQTQTKPTLFFAPAKHSLRSLELLKNSQKGIQGLMDLRQKELERELAANVGEEPEHEDETAEPMRSFVAESESNRKRRHERSGSKEENGSESDEECRKSPEEEEVNPKEDSPEKEADEVELQEEDE